MPLVLEYCCCCWYVLWPFWPSFSQILLQQGPQQKGTVNDLVIKVLTPEVSACCDLSCCGIEGSDVKLLIKGAEWEALDCTFVSELSIIAEHGCPVEMLVYV